jgi:hypothetical protein
MSPDRVVYNGVEMAADWPARIEASQLQLTLRLNGRVVTRVSYGREEEDQGALRGLACADCGVVREQLHVLGCEMEQCPICAGQLVSCGCLDEMPATGLGDAVTEGNDD